MAQHRRRVRGKRRASRRTGVAAPYLAAIAAVVAVIAAAVYLAGIRPGSGGGAGAAALAAVPGSRTVLLLEQQREELIAMSSAYGTLSLVGTPRLASRQSLTPPSVGGGGAGGVPAGPPPNPGSAQAIAWNMMASFGFDPHVYFGCLNNIWTRESGWVYNAMNPSGAYGIPQALPGSKMASAGADWQTNPATQIRWGLGYIKASYGDPCSAWAFWQAHSYY